MAASVNDKITDVRNSARPNSTTASGTRSSGGTTLACASLAGWPTASKVHGVTYQIDSNSNPIAGTQLDFSAIVSANNLTSFTVIDGTDTGNSIGDVVEMLPTAAWGQDLAEALLEEHTRTGAHSAITADSLSTDTITEGTSGSGVMVDGLSIKDSKLVTANSVVTANYTDASILPEHLVASTGTSWAWQDFTPSLTNWTIGTGGSAGTTAKYIQIGKTVIVRLKSVLGSSGQSVSGEPTFNLPVTASANYANLDPTNICWMNAGGTGAMGYVRLTSTTAAKIVVMSANATYVGDGTISSTVPGTWAAGNQFSTTFVYEAT